MTTTNIEKTIVSHQTQMSSDEYSVLVAEYAIKNKTTVVGAIQQLIAIEVKKTNFQFYLGGSFFNVFSANPLAAMVSKANKVFFGLNSSMIRGTALHYAREFALKHKMETGKLLPLMQCIKAMRANIEERWKFLNPSLLEKSSKFEVFLEIARAFKLYYYTILVSDECFQIEEGYNLSFPKEIFNNPHHSKNFIGSGTFDGIAKSIVDEKEIFTMVDLKSSIRRISSSVEIDRKLEMFFLEKEKLLEIEKILNKKINKFSNSDSKIAEAKSNLETLEAKLEDATSNGKATLALEKRVLKQSEEVQLWTNNLNVFEESYKEAELVRKELDELNVMMKPLEDVYAIAKKDADLKECRKLHESQLVYYAILEHFKSGKKIQKLRIENIVLSKSKRGELYINKPEVQIFEWELTDQALAETEEKVLAIIHSVEAVMEGVDPAIIFRPNWTTFYGMELENLVEEIKEMVKINSL